MKNPKKPTRAQRKLLERWNLNTGNWLVSKDTPTEMVVVHRHSDQVRIIYKEAAP